MPYISYYRIHLNVKDTLSWNTTPCSLAGTCWHSPYSQTWLLQMINKNMIQWAKLTLYYCICQLSVTDNSDFLRVTAFRILFQFSNIIHHICSWVHQGGKRDVSLSSICSKSFLLWYSFMIHKGYISLPSLAKHTCSTSSPICCPSVWPWEKKSYWIYVCLLHIKDWAVTITKFAAG